MADTKGGRRPGRPRKYGQGRINATVRFTPDRYARLKASADANGRSVSEEVEMCVERAAQYDLTIAALGRSLDEIKRGNAEAAFRAEGYTAIHSPHGKIWVPPGYPMERSPGFMTQEERDRFIAQEEDKT
jgi:hypothetical protein